ncbi:hypothetical protein LH23_18285 [Cedecea neteri]|uniref:Uncharacterized protein n=1 Tax=Cedecea neteri TaxID=158822 RepID=A0AAN0S6N1_9ENTR|nr:hypothetical protein [Cedecea neteri]AIR62533.1 hypothetical protein LH23_18285 [Cedecea neteri]
MNTSNGKELYDVISKLGDIEWRRIPSRYPSFKFKSTPEFSEDRSSRPPATSFRFSNENDQIIALLEKAVNSYCGILKWTLISQKKEFGEGVNRCILPEYVNKKRDFAWSEFQLTADKYMEKYEPDFGPIAYEDLVGLAMHVRAVFKNAGYDV